MSDSNEESTKGNLDRKYSNIANVEQSNLLTRK